MTEKDFRKLITDIELTSSDKNEITSTTNYIVDLLKSNLRSFTIENVVKAGSYATSTLNHFYKSFDIALYFNTKIDKNFVLVNQAVINEIWNILFFNLNIEKRNQLYYSELDNCVSVLYNNIYVNIYIRFVNILPLQNDFLKEYDDIRLSFVNIASTEFKLFKNTLTLLKYIKEKDELSIPSYHIDLLLYYGLSVNFTTHTYEAYLKEFIHAIDDLLKGIKIDQDDQTYRKLSLKRSSIVKKAYTLIDISRPSINLYANIQEGQLNEYRKFKRIISKYLEN